GRRGRSLGNPRFPRRSVSPRPRRRRPAGRPAEGAAHGRGGPRPRRRALRPARHGEPASRPGASGSRPPPGRRVTGLSRARRQGIWLAGGQAATRLTQLVTTVILARLLVPEDFGKVAIASVAWEVTALFANTGIAATLIHRRERIEELSEAA